MDFSDFFWVGSQKVKIIKARSGSFGNDRRKGWLGAGARTLRQCDHFLICFLVVSTKGGVGKSTLITNLAVYLTQSAYPDKKFNTLKINKLHKTSKHIKFSSNTLHRITEKF